MADEIRIVSIELNNYRQYYGKQKIDFSSRNEGFTVIIGENGEGKSNLLNAINWCFYKKEPHGKKDENDISAPVINSHHLLERGKDKIASTSVKVILQIGDEYYSISRVLTVQIGDIEYEKLEDGELLMQMARYADDKVPSGCEILYPETGFEIKKRGKNETDFHPINEDLGYKINQILPQRLSVFFLLDGEFLEKFWDSFERVEEGIQEISHLHLLSSAIDHVSELPIRRTSLNDGSEIDHLQKIIMRNQYYEKSLGDDGNILWSEKPRWIKKDESGNDEFYHATGKPRIKDLDHDIKKMDRRTKEISRQIPDINTASAKVLQDQYVAFEALLRKEKKEKKENEERWKNSLIENAPYVFAKNAIVNSVNIIEQHLEKGDLPNETKTTFTNDLLERGTCICDSDLRSKIMSGIETNKERLAVERARDKIAGDIGLDGALRMKYNFKDKLFDNYDNFLKTKFGDLQQIYLTSKENADDINKKLKGIKDQLGDAGDEKIQDLINEQDHINEQIQTAIEEKEYIKKMLATKANENDECQQKIIRLSDKDKRAQKDNHQTKIWNEVNKQLQTVYDDLNTETRTEMQNKTWEIFQKILYESKKFKKFIIQSDYSVILLNNQNQNHIVDISAGQSLFLAISFVTALREITGYKFPLVIDTPIGKISGSNQYNLAKILPTYLKSEQISFLATDTEWIAPIPNIAEDERDEGSFGELITKLINIKHFRIKQDKEGRSSIRRAIHRDGGIQIVE